MYIRSNNFFFFFKFHISVYLNVSMCTSYMQYLSKPEGGIISPELELTGT